MELKPKISAARAGDREAMGALLEVHREKLLRFFIKRVRTLDDAETLVQRTFLAAINAMPGFRGDCPFDRWLWRIGAHECIRYYKQRARQDSELSLDDGAWGEDAVQQIPADEPLNRTEDRVLAESLLASAKKSCSPTEFQVMMLYYRTESFDEVADLMDMNPATVRSHFLRGRSNLLAHLLLERPDLLGGQEAVQNAVRLARQSVSFSNEELDALKHPKSVTKPLRSACLKIARHFPTEGLL